MRLRLWGKILMAAALLMSLTAAPDGVLVRGSCAADLALFGKHLRHYTMNAGVRFIPFFWLSKNNVGGGKIAWDADSGGARTLALLIGSDPARAPRKINRWGYIVERVSGAGAELTGIMTPSNEQSIDEAKASTEKSSRRYAFKGIRSRLNGAEAQSSTFRMEVSANYTYKDAEILVGQLPASGASVRKLRIPAGTDSGFLFSVKEMLHETAERCRRSGKVAPPKPRQYVYNAVLFQLTMPSARRVKILAANGREYRQLIESEFEARNSANGKVSHFMITYGVEDPFLEVPIRIVYQPRWWFRAELLLDESAAPGSAAVPAANKRCRRGRSQAHQVVEETVRNTFRLITKRSCSMVDFGQISRFNSVG